ncbi:MAG: FtsX-like permease family protein [Clostridia bacterium]
MKILSIFKMSYKNLFNNFMRSALVFTTIVLLSIVIIFFSNFCYFLKVSINENILKEVNSNGINAKISALQSDTSLSTNDVSHFINDMEDLKIFEEYSILVEDIIAHTGDSCELKLSGYIANSASNLKPIITLGKHWTAEDTGKNNIWLSSVEAKKLNLTVGDTILVSYNFNDFGKDNINSAKYFKKDFLIKGIVDSTYSFIDYSFLPIKEISFSLSNPQYKNLDVILKLNKLDKMAQKAYNGGSNGVFFNHIKSDVKSLYKFSMEFFNIALGLCVTLILITFLLCIGCMLNSLKINIENNLQLIGILRALGMRNKDINIFFIFQIVLLTVIGTLIAMFFAWIIGLFSLKFLINFVLEMIFNSFSTIVVTGFNFLFSLCNILILIFLSLMSFLMLRNYFKKSIISILQEDNK